MKLEIKLSIKEIGNVPSIIKALGSAGIGNDKIFNIEPKKPTDPICYHVECGPVVPGDLIEKIQAQGATTNLPKGEQRWKKV
ncbi:hypothetical protein L6252_00720 [Candidatus Parcubacteria bacterium]|nr:hypothetical protein [Candidatus Parcubacteria bacterium]